MKIIDINGRERECEDIRYMERDAQKWVRATFFRQRTGQTWHEWYPVDDFKSRNPDKADMI